jgi:hypothetical protein
MSKIRDERIKLFATLLNNMANACFAVGMIAPLAGAFISGNQANRPGWLELLASFFAWLMAVVALHLTASHLLGGIKDD